MKCVSIIIPVYNCEKYIEKTIDSVLKQTYKNFEILVINDGSTDNTLGILKKIQTNESRLIIINQSNRGVSTARNTGISYSSGDYIAFLDGDDIWHPTKLEEQLKALDEGFGACYCGFNFYVNDSYKVENKIDYQRGNILEKYIRQDTWSQTSCWLVKSSIIKSNEVYFYENCSWGEDLEFFIKIMCLTKCNYVKKTLVDYRIREESLTKDNNNTLNAIEVWIRVKKWLLENEYLSEKLCNRLIENYHIPLIKIKYLNQNPTIVKKEYDRLLKEAQHFRPFCRKRDIKSFIILLKLIIKNIL